MKTLFSITIIGTLLLSCTPAFESSVVGTWKLVEFTDLDTLTNEWEYPFGKSPKGYFTYTSTGIVNLNISNEVPIAVSPDSLSTTSFTYEQFISNSVGYFGRYSVSLEDSVVIHHVEGGSLPFYIGTDQPRPFRLENDTLTISDGKTWKRVLVRAD